MSSDNKLKELNTIISKMPLRMICGLVLPEFGLRWREISRVVRNSRLAMTPSNLARILCKHISKDLPDEIDDIIARLRLIFVTIQNRKWHVITLIDQSMTETMDVIINKFEPRTIWALRNEKNRMMKPEVHKIFCDDLMFVSLQMVSDVKNGPVLFAATPLGEPVALVSSTNSGTLTQAFVKGLGYSKYELANLHGYDIQSLLRIHNRGYNDRAEHLSGSPEYNPGPVITHEGIDYTNRQQAMDYVDALLGPDPPLLTELVVTTTKPLFDKAIGNESFRMKFVLKCDDVASTLKSWVKNGALAPTSDLFCIFSKMKSNNIVNED